MSRLLLDTHVLLWALLSPAKLSAPIRALLRDRGTNDPCFGQFPLSTRW